MHTHPKPTYLPTQASLRAADAATLTSSKAAAVLSPSFFFGTESGQVAYADDLGHYTEVGR